MQCSKGLMYYKKRHGYSNFRYARDAEAECKYCGIVMSTISSVHDHARKEHLDLICQVNKF